MMGAPCLTRCLASALVTTALGATFTLVGAPPVHAQPVKLAKVAAKKSGAKKSVAKTQSPEEVAAAFATFCEEWMQRLAARERDNVQHIKWETTSDGAHGSYTGYSHEHTCTQSQGTENVPVGRIKYRELLYEKRGPTLSAAESSAPQTVEVYEVTEIFRYGDGKWDF